MNERRCAPGGWTAAPQRDAAAQDGLAASGARGRVVFDDDAAADGAARC